MGESVIEDGAHSDYTISNPTILAYCEGKTFNRYEFTTTDGVVFTILIEDAEWDDRGVIISNYLGTEPDEDGEAGAIKLLTAEPIPDDGFTPLIYVLLGLIAEFKGRNLKLYPMGRKETPDHSKGVNDDDKSMLEKLAIKLDRDEATGLYVLLENDNDNSAKARAVISNHLWHTIDPDPVMNGLSTNSFNGGSTAAIYRAWRNNSAITLAPITLLSDNTIGVKFRRVNLPEYAEYKKLDQETRENIAYHLGLLFMGLLAYDLPEDQRGNITNPIEHITDAVIGLEYRGINIMDLNP